MTHPYSDIPDYCFWSKAMTWPSPGQIDPVVNAATISPSDKVATMGSCFAQNISNYLKKIGSQYYVAETGPADMEAALARSKGYGIFSARYGNVYTVRQAVQLFDRAFGRFAPVDDVWTHGDAYVDAFRPTIEPCGYESPAAVRDEAEQHLRHVRDMFSRCDWLVFTLGLTECWTSTHDGAVYPLAPGVHGGTFDPSAYAFHNFTVDEVRDDLTALIEKVRSVNGKARIILTVSPVPLVATYERRHVLVSTTASKSILRTAADEAERKFDHVFYFPSYEIVTSPAAAGRYFEDDLRGVTEIGVGHVMRMFKAHFLSADIKKRPPVQTGDALPTPSGDEIVCDEEWIEHARKVSGFASA